MVSNRGDRSQRTRRKTPAAAGQPGSEPERGSRQTRRQQHVSPNRSPYHEQPALVSQTHRLLPPLVAPRVAHTLVAPEPAAMEQADDPSSRVHLERREPRVERVRTVARVIGRVALSRGVLSCALALVTAMVLQRFVSTALTAFFEYLNFDSDRAQILSSVLLALPSACAGAFLWRRRAAALCGALLGFTLVEGVPFIQQALHPGRDVLGAAVAVSGMGTVRAVLALYSMGLFAAALGSGFGGELGDWVGSPLVRLTLHLARVARQRVGGGLQSSGRQFVWLQPLAQAAVVIAALALGISSLGRASDMLFYGPQVLTQSAVVVAGGDTSIAGHVDTVSYASAIFGGAQRSIEIYLPPGYESAAKSGVRYPVVYLLHGSPGHNTGMFTALLPPQYLDRLIAGRDITPVIAVAPDGNSAEPFPSEWLNSANGHARVEDAFVQEVVPYIDAHYRTIALPSGRVLSGLSMGGYGGVNLAVKHPDVFGGVIAMGAYFVPEGGAVRGHPDLIAANSPILQLEHMTTLPRVRFFLAAAKQDVPYVSDTVAFAHILHLLGMSYSLEVTSGGHSWQVWSRQIVDGLRWFFSPSTGQVSCGTCVLHPHRNVR